MPLTPLGQFLYVMILFSLWIGVPLWTITSLVLALWKPRSRAVWIVWSVLLVVNVPGVFVGGHWLLWEWFPALENNKNYILSTPIIFGIPILCALGLRKLVLVLRG